ncbi:MAG TPA: HDOD domain-containing protein [Sedimenticola thiotaurini]|uniref:HDOD domain-containing protein n=1 Tax=Sedimenticola thiotaurini TaxID=1543721 RepID=A0A831RIH7_9GAMM|nr:HDOD domain-containing protein [Sedimenticola thiotaurini]
MITQEAFASELEQAIQQNHITLPTLPEVALRVRDAVERDDATAAKIAEMVTTDAALSARLLQVANSPLYRGRVPIESVQMAVTRLGNKLVRSLVVSLAMKQIFQATSDTLDRRLRALWEESVQIAAISRVLVQTLPHLDREQAMLAGLIHNIGSLPILTMAESYPELLSNPQQLDSYVKALNPRIGGMILRTWGFSDNLVKVAEHYRDYDYDSGDRADYVDVVQVARLQTLGDDGIGDWSTIPAFRKLGLEPEVEVIEIEGVAEDVDEMKAIFL